GLALFVRSTGGLAALRETIRASGPFVLGAFVGLLPTMLYAMQRFLSGRVMEPSLPLGLRPVGTIGETVEYLYRGLPLLLGGDARPFLDLVRVGRAYPIAPLSDLTAGAVGRLNLLVLGALLTAGIVLLRQYGREIADAL